MRTTLAFLVTTCLLLSCYTSKPTVQKQFEKIVNLCEKGNLEELSNYIVYSGEDEGRKWKDICNYENPEERERVEDIAEEIQELIDETDSYTIKKSFTNKESEGVWHILEVVFRKGDEERKFYFAFLEINERYAIGDIDN